MNEIDMKNMKASLQDQINELNGFCVMTFDHKPVL